MRFEEFFEQVGMIGTTSMTPPAAGQLTGNVAALSDPKLQAATLAQQKKAKDEQKNAIQTQIAALQKQLSDLNRTP
jgi:hypothetical protein